MSAKDLAEDPHGQAGPRERLAHDDVARQAELAAADGRPLSIGVLGNCADTHPLIADNGKIPDVVTDQTSAHDPLNGYIPAGYTLERATILRKKDPETYLKESRASIARHLKAMLLFQKSGSRVFDYDALASLPS